MVVILFDTLSTALYMLLLRGHRWNPWVFSSLHCIHSQNPRVFSSITNPSVPTMKKPLGNRVTMGSDVAEGKSSVFPIKPKGYHLLITRVSIMAIYLHVALLQFYHLSDVIFHMILSLSTCWLYSLDIL